jgi:hypothetical protein
MTPRWRCILYGDRLVARLNPNPTLLLHHPHTGHISCLSAASQKISSERALSMKCWAMRARSNGPAPAASRLTRPRSQSASSPNSGEAQAVLYAAQRGLIDLQHPEHR